jgi:enoyl-CoA hydratase/carnithine racemase
MTDRILLEREGDQVAVLRLNRPDRLNAIDHPSIETLHRLLAELDADDRIRVAIITGTGRAFSAGADLKEMDSTPQSEVTVRAARNGLQLYQDITRQMVNSRVVFIAAINGIAVGVGAELSLAADIRIGSDGAELMLSEVRRGLFETNGVLHFLPRVVGQGRAARWLLTGERINAGELLDSGFLTEVVPADQLMSRARELALTIAGNAPLSVRLLKQLLRRTWEVDLEAMLQYEVVGMLACMASEDLEVVVYEFYEKRVKWWKV